MAFLLVPVGSHGVATAVRPVALTGLNNYRDLCGTPTMHGRVIGTNRILRSATPAGASEAAVEHLHGLGLRTVIDLRREHEAAQDEGDRLLAHGPHAPATHFVPMSVEDHLRGGIKKKALARPQFLLTLLAFGPPSKISPSRRIKSRAKLSLERKMITLLDSATLEEIYWWVLLGHGPEIKRVVETCARPEQLPALVHCTHGKDRTGLAVAMLLHACGVAPEHIAADYALSNDWGCSVEGRRAMDAMLPPHLQGVINIDRWCEAPEDVIYALWALIEKKCGSVDAYLDKIGVDASLRQRCVAALTEPAPA